MKKFKSMFLCAIICALMMSVTTSTYAQVTKEEKQEAKAREKNEKETAKDLFSKSPKEAEKQAKKLEKEGWKTMNLPISKQLEVTWMKSYETDPMSGYFRYITATVETTGNSFAAAQAANDNIIKSRIAGQIKTMVMSEAKVDLANQQLSAKDAVSVTKVLEKSTNMVAEKLGRMIKTMEIYKIVNGNYVVRATMVYDMSKVMDMVKSEAVQQLQKELDDWTPTYEKMLNNIVDGVKSSYTPQE